MTQALLTLPAPDSPLRRLDPRWKLGALGLAALAAAALRAPATSLVAFGGALGLLVIARVPPRWYATRIAAAGLFLLVVVATLPFLIHGDEPLGHLGPLAISWTGLRVALVLAAKALTILTLALVLLASTPVNATLRAAHALRIPGVLVQLAVLTYRYLFVIGAELSRLRVALRVRGYRNRPSRHCYRTVGHVAGSLLVRSYERAERVGQAMRCRGFQGRYQALTTFRTTAGDVGAFVAITGTAAALLAWDLLQRG